MFSKEQNASQKSRRKRESAAAVAAEAQESVDDAPVEAAEAPSPVCPELDADSSASEPSDEKTDKGSPEALELAMLKDRYARLLADFDNYRKRQARDSAAFIKRANERLLGDLLPVVDHLELALAKTPDPDDPFVIGVQLVYDQIIALLNRYEMTPIDARGELFDPAYHEALSQSSSATVPAHRVIDQFRRGWLLAGKLLRPAQVIVSSGIPDQEAAEAEAQSVSD